MPSRRPSARASPSRPARRSTTTASREPAATSERRDDEHRDQEGEGTARPGDGIRRDHPAGDGGGRDHRAARPQPAADHVAAMGRDVATYRVDDPEGHGHEGDDREHVQPAEGALVDVPDPERGDRGPEDEHDPDATEQAVAGVALRAAPHLVAAEHDAGQGADDVGDDEQGPRRARQTSWGTVPGVSCWRAPRGRARRPRAPRVGARRPHEPVEAVAEGLPRGGRREPPVRRERQAATVARAPGDVDVAVTGQAGDHPRHGGLAGAEPRREVALGHPVTLGHVQQHEEARIGQLRSPSAAAGRRRGGP